MVLPTFTPNQVDNCSTLASELLQVPGFTALVASWQREERLQATAAEAFDGDSMNDIDGTAKRQTRTDMRTEAETAAWQAATDAEAALKAPPCGECVTCRAAVQANISVRPRALTSFLAWITQAAALMSQYAGN